MADITTKYKSAFTGAEIDKGVVLARNAVPLDGSKAMTGPLILNSGHAALAGYKDNAILAHYADITNDDRILLTLSDTVNTAKILQLMRYSANNARTALYSVLHTGNKPSGSYTGNGSAAARTIEIEGFGNHLMIKGAGWDVLVGEGGGMAHYKTSTEIIGIPSTELSFVGNTLAIVTAAGSVNNNGTVYTYERF